MLYPSSEGFTIVRRTPQAVLVLHAVYLTDGPLQLAPLYAGAGLVHARV